MVVHPGTMEGEHGKTFTLLDVVHRYVAYH